MCYAGYIAWKSLFKQKSEQSLTSVPIGELGTFGDFFGGISNPIIGAIGFIVLTFTIRMQIKQNKETIKQNFESSFFNLLNLQNNIIENLNYDGETARASFTKFLNENRTILYPNNFSQIKVMVKQSKAKVFYSKYNSSNNGVFGHYFRNLYRILKMIHDSEYSDAEKKKHARILRAQLSMDELTVLFLNCLPGVCDKGEFSELLIQYQILEHVSITKLINPNNTSLNYRYSEFIIGGKIRVSYTEVESYLKKQSESYYNRITSGAFGRNTSRDLALLKTSLRMRDNLMRFNRA